MFEPNRQFQAGLNPETVRRQRQKASLSLRRQDRQIKLQNKRQRVLQRVRSKNATTNGTATTTAGSGTPWTGTATAGRGPSTDAEHKAMLQSLPKFVAGCFTEHKSTIFECTQKIRELLSFHHSAPIAQVVDSGVVSRIIQFLRWTDCPELQFEAMWVLTNIASSDRPEFTAKVVRDGAIPAIVEILEAPSYRLLEQAVWALGNIAGDCIELRNLVMSEGAVRRMKALCKKPFDASMCSSNPSSSESDPLDGKAEWVSMLRNLSWSISNLCRFGASRSEKAHGQWPLDLVECLAALLRQNEVLRFDEEDGSADGLGANIGWSCTYLTNDFSSEPDTVPLLDAMNKLKVTEAMIGLLGSANPFTVHSSLRAIGNVLTGNDRYTAHCIDCGVLQRLYALTQQFYAQNVNHEKLKEICWAISNVTAGPSAQIVRVIEAKFVPVLIDILKGSRNVIASEALWAVSNATASADDRVVGHLVEHGLIEGLCQFLKNKFGAVSYHRSSEKLLIATLECIEHILSSKAAVGDGNAPYSSYSDRFEEFGGVDFLEYLQSEDAVSRQIYEFAVRLIRNHFDVEEEAQGLGPFDSNRLAVNDPLSTQSATDQLGSHFVFGINSPSNTKPVAREANRCRFEF